MEFLTFDSAHLGACALSQRPEPVAPAIVERSRAHIMATYRRQAIRGRNYAFGHGWAEDSARPMVQEPKASAPIPNPARKPLEMISVNGFRKPLRAFDYRDLNREYWSAGKVVNEGNLERNRARELASLKDTSEMTLKELEDSQDSELMSESRRSWLETGAGILHLDATDYDEGSIGEAIADDLRLAEFEPVNLETASEIDWEHAAKHNAFGARTPFEGVDPITAKQIDWEKRVWHDSEVRTLKVEDGKLRVFNYRGRPTRFEDPAHFMAVAKRVIGFLMPAAGNDEDVERRVTKLSADAVRVLSRKFDAYVRNEIERAEYTSEDRDEWASSWISADGLLHHRSNLRSKDEFWHQEQQDRAEVALFNHLGPDEAVEELMGRDVCPTPDCEGSLTHIEERRSAVCSECEEWVSYGTLFTELGIFTETGWHLELTGPKPMGAMRISEAIGFTLEQLTIVRQAAERAVARMA